MARFIRLAAKTGNGGN